MFSLLVFMWIYPLIGATLGLVIYAAYPDEVESRTTPVHFVLLTSLLWLPAILKRGE